jgi:hypothetical protein
VRDTEDWLTKEGLRRNDATRLIIAPTNLLAFQNEEKIKRATEIIPCQNSKKNLRINSHKLLKMMTFFG